MKRIFTDFFCFFFVILLFSSQVYTQNLNEHIEKMASYRVAEEKVGISSSRSEKVIIKIQNLGNSITHAEQGHNSYRRRLAQKLDSANIAYDMVGSMNTVYNNMPHLNEDFDTDHEGHWAWRADEIINGINGQGKLSEWIQYYDIDFVVIRIGTNDLIQGQTYQNILDEFSQIITILRVKNPKVVVFLSNFTPNSYPNNHKIIPFNALLPDFVRGISTANSPVILVDQYTGFSLADTYDNIHPNLIGEEKMAQKWLEAILTYLETRWTGATSTDWNTAGNWSTNSVPTSTNNVVINDVINDPVIGAGTSASVNNITVNASGNLTIQSSSATNTGSLIVAGTATGNVTFQSYLAETNKWHVVAPPVASQNIWDFAILAGNNIAENSGKRAVTEYFESTNTWDTNYPTSNSEGSFIAGIGYSVLRASPGVVSYTGTINTSDVSKLLTRGGAGWNALGNPYTSAINANITAHATDNLITANTSAFDQSFAAMYVWDAVSGAYVTINNTSNGTNPENYIQAGQGFFVRAKDNTGLNFSISEAMQSHQTAVPLKSVGEIWPTIQLSTSTIGKFSSTVVTFNRNMTTGLDVTYDAGMFKADKDFALYTKLVDDNGVDFAIQALPDSQFEKLVIPLGIDAPSGTRITFTAVAMNLPVNVNVYLEDRAAKNITKLDIAGAKYAVTITEQTKGAGNFFLHTSLVTTAISELENNLIVYTHDRAIYVNGITDVKDIVAVYGIDGKLHHRKPAGANGLLRIEAKEYPAGIYFISVEQKAGRVTHKVVITE